MIEIGVLYGGSALQWLEWKHNLLLVGIDPWDFNEDQVKYWWNNRHAYGIENLKKGSMSDQEFLSQLLKFDAAYQATLSNLWNYRDRFIPIRGRSPDQLYILSNLGFIPDLVYFDSDKKLNDLWICNDIWPNALLTGDDWSWSSEDRPSDFPVQTAVNTFANERGFTVQFAAATWCLIPEHRRN